MILLLLATLQLAHLGDFKLDNGQTIRNCVVGYRTYGTLAADKSNVIVVLTWFGGTTEGLEQWIGPGRLYDSAKYFVVSIDAFGDGVSSSPSNGANENFTMRDMVRAQHEFLTRQLKIEHVLAVSGLSMGGMQTFQWIASYPDFMTKAIPIVGSPKLTNYDLMFWKSELSAIAEPGGMKVAGDMNELHLYTPAWMNAHIKDVDRTMREHEGFMSNFNVNDYASQLRLMIGLDIGAPPAKLPQMLVVVSEQDLTVNPAPARDFARATNSQLLTLTSDCGHLATSCERDRLTAEVQRFLAH